MAKTETKQTSGKWTDFLTRLVSALLLVGIQAVIILAGHYAIFVELTILQYLVFREFINLSINKIEEKNTKLPFSIRVVPYLLCTIVNYHMSAKKVFSSIFNDAVLDHYHPLIFFMSLMVCLVLFVVGLTPENTEQSYQLLGFSIIAIVISVFPVAFYGRVAEFSLFWFFMAIGCVIWNDTAAYIFGRMLGRTPLIKLSPKKTVEGFVGALIVVPIIAWLFPLAFAKWPFSYCFASKPFDIFMTCETPKEFTLCTANIGGKTIGYYPAQLHCLVLALFASTIAPFGGFLASGLKRALGIKDFSNLIPGHGGIIDRVDCQLVMGTFTYIYLITFVYN